MCIQNQFIVHKSMVGSTKEGREITTSFKTLRVMTWKLTKIPALKPPGCLSTENFIEVLRKT